MSRRQQEVIDSLPSHLRGFAQLQDYQQYTPRDHAVWRFILHQLARRLRHTAHPVYQEGLARTGISLERIPSIDEMNRALEPLGWAAIVVDGFIPPAIFMEFQARQILVIALDMRSIDHILYTPAPDIVHESAGHAPFIVDIDYAEYLQRFGEIGMKAISHADDLATYEAIRHLSILKESPQASAQDIQQAEQRLEQALERQSCQSEASRLSRLHWWTVEYGLVGELDDYRIFGAGLLSSLGESEHCLDDKRVRKQMLTVDVVDCPYDITQEQPQLFVTRNCRHMTQILEEFEKSMSFRRGGRHGLEQAIESASVCTAQYNSGLQVSGVFKQLICDAVGQPVYLGTQGPTALAQADKELPGHGRDRHPEGFGSPIGKLQKLPHCLSSYSIDELREAGIACGQHCELNFLSGIQVSGNLCDITRHEHRNLLFHFRDCRVQDRHGNSLFEPDWGDYDMAVGAEIVSVFGGAADRERYPLYEHLKPEPTPNLVPSAEEQALYDLYQDIRDYRETDQHDRDVLENLIQRSQDYPEQWLLLYELAEISLSHWPEAASELIAQLRQLARQDRYRDVLAYALEGLDQS